MRFDWDETKDAANLRKHGVGFEAASLVFDDPMQLSAQDREVDGEERWQTIGMAGGVLLLLVAHPFEDEDEEEVVRIISARKANVRERRQYEDGT
ncbi:MAG TPA: BrnT family toxin [Acidobacteriaceae bacterium]|nr:BrnT family toxin [Acidobacteriaceae bacterium]